MAQYGVPVAIKRFYKIYVDADDEFEAREKAKKEALENYDNDSIEASMVYGGRMIVDCEMNTKEQDIEIGEPYYIGESEECED